MTRDYFDLDDGATRMHDEVGLECESLQEARAAAIAALPEMVKEDLPDGDQHRFVVRLRDAGGTNIFEAVLRFEARWLVPQPR